MAAIIIVIGIVAAIAGNRSKTPGVAVSTSSPSTAAPAFATDPNGQQCTALDGNGYCPGDDPSATPIPTPTGPAHASPGQPVTISDTSNQTAGTVTVLSATVTTQPANPSFGQAPANGYYVFAHISATADSSYTPGFYIDAVDFYCLDAGQHFDSGNGNAVDALSNSQSNQDITATLAAGETSSGWESFDVPRPHGFIVYAPNISGPPLAEWQF